MICTYYIYKHCGALTYYKIYTSHTSRSSALKRARARTQGAGPPGGRSLGLSSKNIAICNSAKSV